MFGIFLKFFDFFYFAHLWSIFTDGRSYNLSKDVDGLVDRPQVGFRLETPSTLSNVAFQFKRHD